MEAIGAITERVRAVERQSDTNTAAVNELTRTSNTQGTDIAVIKQQALEIRSDVAELKEQLRWVLRGIWGAAGTFLLCAATIVAVVFSHGG